MICSFLFAAFAFLFAAITFLFAAITFLFAAFTFLFEAITFLFAAFFFFQRSSFCLPACFSFATFTFFLCSDCFFFAAFLFLCSESLVGHRTIPMIWPSKLFNEPHLNTPELIYPRSELWKLTISQFFLLGFPKYSLSLQCLLTLCHS